MKIRTCPHGGHQCACAETEGCVFDPENRPPEGDEQKPEPRPAEPERWST